MKASELRIGNYITKGTFTIYRVEGLLHTTVYTESMSFPESEFKGIELTEEWLLKFGFEKWDGGDSCYVKKYSHQGELILFDWKTPVAQANNINQGDYYYFMFHHLIHTIKYVHQLQNLYFALTGEELLIKL